MRETLVNGKRSIIAHHESAEVAEPGESAFHNPPSLVASQRPTILSR